MKDAEVLILDKASSALDAKAETEAFKQIIKLTAGKIAAIVSDRYITVLIANRIMVLKDGKVLENGTQGESMANKILYHELFTLHAGPIRNHCEGLGLN